MNTADFTSLLRPRDLRRLGAETLASVNEKLYTRPRVPGTGFARNQRVVL
jgi:hypothetical protein